MATWTREAPRPPYSTGQWTPTQRPLARRRCHSRSVSASLKSDATSMSGGLFSDSHARNSSRNARSAGERSKSMPEGLHARAARGQSLADDEPVYGDVGPVRSRVSCSRVDDLDRVDGVGQTGDAQESEAGRRAVRVDRR